MVHLNGSTDNFIVEALPEKTCEDESLREERRKTGRYLATGIAIFLVVVGLYHAVTQGATKYATLLGTVLIMFLYLLWLLYASQRKKKLLKLNAEILQQTLEESRVNLQKSEDSLNVPHQETHIGKKARSSHEIFIHVPPPSTEKSSNHHALNRTYSIA